MTGICSKHRERVEDCRLCNLSASDVLPEFATKVKEAEASGTRNCSRCGFTYYTIAYFCPMCSGRN